MDEIKKPGEKNQKKTEKMKVSTLIFALVGVIALSISLTMLFYSFYIVKDVKEIPINLTIGNKLGIDLSKGVLSYGILPKGGSSSRAIFLENTYKEPLIVQFKIKGRLFDWIEFSENNFILKENESKRVDITMNVPSDAEYKSYDCKLRVIFRKQFFI